MYLFLSNQVSFWSDIDILFVVQIHTITHSPSLPMSYKQANNCTLSRVLSSLYGILSGRYVCNSAQKARPSFQLLLKFVMSIFCGWEIGHRWNAYKVTLSACKMDSQWSNILNDVWSIPSAWNIYKKSPVLVNKGWPSLVLFILFKIQSHTKASYL